MRFNQLTVNTTKEGSELVADVMTELGSRGVCIYDKDDLIDLVSTGAGWDYIDEKLLESLTATVKVCGFYDPNVWDIESRLEAALEKLKERSAFPLGSLETVFEEIDDSDWNEVWKKYYRPFKVGRITVVPEWCEPPKQVDGQVVWLNPGIAFGTGQHETTRGCIELLQFYHRYYSLRDKKVLDIGCGSGILGITAVTLGAAHADLTDIDPIAASAAQGNIALNTREEVCKVYIDDFTDPASVTAGIKADLIIANLSADLLIKHADKLLSRLKKDGMLILSGVIDSRYAEFEKAYTDRGFKRGKDILKGEWHAVMFKSTPGFHPEG